MTYPKDVRADQLSEGRKMNYDKPYERRPIAKGGYVAKGHDAVLKVLQDTKALVLVILMSGDHMVGTIIGRDRFTISLRTADGDETIYKHAIERFVRATAIATPKEAA